MNIHLHYVRICSPHHGPLPHDLSDICGRNGQRLLGGGFLGPLGPEPHLAEDYVPGMSTMHTGVGL